MNSGGKPIPIYYLQFISTNNNLDKNILEMVLFESCLLYKEIYISPEKDRGFVYFHDQHELNLGLQAFSNHGGYSKEEDHLIPTTTSTWVDGSE